MRGDFPFFAILPIIMLAITFITSVLFMAWQQVTPVINASMNQVNAPQQYHQAYMSVGNNLYTFDMYLAFIFFALLLASIASTVFLSSNPIAWMVGIVLLPFTYFIAAEESNVARSILMNSAIKSGVVHLSFMQVIFANLDLIVIIFAAIYVIMLGIRMYFFNPAGSGGSSAPVKY